MHASDVDLRAAKSFLSQDGRLLVTNGVDLVRVKPISNSTYQTTRNGTRLDGMPDPEDEDVPLNRDIRMRCAIWLARVDDFPGENAPLTGGYFVDIPLIGSFRMLAVEEDWSLVTMPLLGERSDISGVDGKDVGRGDRE